MSQRKSGTPRSAGDGIQGKGTRAHRSRIEALEDRIAPATIVNPLSIGDTTTATFTDGDGDVITVRIAGKAGSVEFFDAGGQPVDDGDSIASVNITGASSDFTLTFSVDPVGNGVVDMGNITSNKTIRGIYSVRDDLTPTTFRLGSFTGVNFSRGGGLSVDTIVGDAADLGVSLSGGLAAETILNIRGDLEAGLKIGDSPKDKIDGSIVIGGSAGSGSPITIELAGPVGAKFAMTQQSSFNGSLTAKSAFNGSIDIDGSVNGTFRFLKGVGSNAVLHSDDWNDVEVTGDFAGIIASESSEVNLQVSGDLKSTARINSSNAITLTVGGNVLKGATAVCDSGITLDIGGNMSGTFIAGSSDLTGKVSGAVKGATMVGSAGVTLAIGAGIAASTITGDNRLELDVAGNVTKSDLINGDGDSIIKISGSVTGSQFSGGIATGTIGGSVKQSRFQANDSNGVSLTVDGDVVKSRFDIDEEVFVTVGGKAIGSSFISSTGGVTLDIGTDLLKSTVVSSDDDIQLKIGRDALDSSFLNDDSQSTWSIGRNFKGVAQSGSGDLTLTVGGSVLAGSQFMNGDNVNLDVAGNFDALVVADQLDFKVGGNVGARTRLHVHDVTDLADADKIGFQVGGSFAGILNTMHFDPSSDVTDGQLHQLVGGIVAAKARFNIEDIAGASAGDTYVFAGKFLGQLNIGGDLDVDLTFDDDVRSITIGGAVRDTINVAGKLSYLAVGGSLFNAASATAGVFVDGRGTVTGNLETGKGFVTVA